VTMGTAVTFDAPPSPPVFQYSFHATPTTWTDARAQCEAAGGQLGAVRNQDYQDALAVLLSGGSVTLARTLSPTVTLTLTLTPTPTLTPRRVRLCGSVPRTAPAKTNGAGLMEQASTSLRGALFSPWMSAMRTALPSLGHTAGGGTTTGVTRYILTFALRFRRRCLRPYRRRQRHRQPRPRLRRLRCVPAPAPATCCPPASRHPTLVRSSGQMRRLTAKGSTCSLRSCAPPPTNSASTPSPRRHRPLSSFGSD